MDRRTLLKTLAGTSLSLSIGGCAGNSPNQNTPDSTEKGPSNPVPATARIQGLGRIRDEGVMWIRVIDEKIPRPVTVNLYLNTPQKTAGEWHPQTFSQNLKEPVLSFDSPSEKLSSNKIVYDGGKIISAEFTEQIQANIPKGVPLSFSIELVEHTLENQSNFLGYLPLMVKSPMDGELRSAGVSRGNADPIVHKLYHSREQTDSGRKYTLFTASTSSRWEVPRLEGIENRSTGFNKNHYTYGMYERPWSITYSVAKETFKEWQDWNKRTYNGETWEEQDASNTYRIFLDGLDSEPVKRVAEKLNAAAEDSGLTSDLAKLRMVTDFVQRIPYESDSKIPSSEPRVKHPVTTLYQFRGDCEDKVVLATSILTQDVFPDFDIAAYLINDPLHIGVGVRKKTVDYDGELDSIGDDENYLYAEVTYPSPLGMLPSDWSQPKITEMIPRGHPNPEDLD